MISSLSKINGNRLFGADKLLILNDAFPYHEIRSFWAAEAVQKPFGLRVSGPYKRKSPFMPYNRGFGETPNVFGTVFDRLMGSNVVQRKN